MSLNICHKCAQGSTEICQDCCKHEYRIYPDRSLMFINHYCVKCKHMRWGIEEYIAERKAQKLEQEKKEMTIKFIKDDSNIDETLTFNMVEENQFFVDENGCLCQKTDEDGYAIIADENGNPFCKSWYCLINMPIKRILPKITKIEF